MVKMAAGKLHIYLLKAEIAISVFALSITTVLIILQVGLRYIFGNSIFWANEMIGFTFVYMCMIGAAIALHTGEHTRMTLLETVCKTPMPAIFRTLSHLCIIFFLIIFSVFSVKYTVINSSMMSTSLRIPMLIPYLALPIGGVLMLMEETIQFANDFKKAEWRRESK